MIDINKEAYKLALQLTATSNQFIAHYDSADWGSSILIMEKHGRAFARMYWYNDDNESVMMDWLDVYEEYRRNGLGTTLQEIREDIARKIGAKKTYLWVHKDTWMHEWYKRRGYVDYAIYENENNAIWMEKTL